MRSREQYMDVSSQFQLSEWHHIGRKDFETE